MAIQKGVDREKLWGLYSLGVTQVRIAEEMGIARNTVGYHIARLKRERRGKQSHAPSKENPPDATKSEPLVNSTTSGSAKPGVSAHEEV